MGDASSIGYLRHLEPGREAAWWIPSVRFLGAACGSVMTYRVTGARGGEGARLVLRIDAVATGWIARPVMTLFAFIDSVMACRQLKSLKERAELDESALASGAARETGARDQYQLYHAIYASGEEVGVPGKEDAPRWRRAAIEDGVIT